MRPTRYSAQVKYYENPMKKEDYESCAKRKNKTLSEWIREACLEKETREKLLWAKEIRQRV